MNNFINLSSDETWSCISPHITSQLDFNKLKDAGLEDGEILEANQIICYFNYVNRSINGLGVTTKGDIVGYYKKQSST